MIDAEIEADVTAYMGNAANDPKMQEIKAGLENVLKEYYAAMQRVKKA